jgi:hypothetical protein
MVAEHSSGDSPPSEHQPAIGRWPVDDDDLIGRCRFHRADREQVESAPFSIVGGVWQVSSLIAAQRVDSGGLGLFGRDGPQPADVPVLGDVTGGEYARHPGLHPVIDEDAPVDRVRRRARGRCSGGCLSPPGTTRTARFGGPSAPPRYRGVTR